MGLDDREPIVVTVDEDLVDIIPGYLAHRRVDIETIHAALTEGDYDCIRMLGHQMKGSGGGYGFDAISTIGLALETAAVRRDEDRIRNQLDVLADYLARLKIISA